MKRKNTALVSLSILAAFAAVLGAARLAPASTAAVPDDLETLVAELDKLKDDADPELVEQIAALGTRDAMHALLGLYDRMASIYMRREIVRGLARFDGVSEAEQPALQKVMDVATGAKERELREAALEALGTCHKHGKDFLALIVQSPSRDEIREEALRLHVALGDEDDAPWYRELFEREGAGETERKKRDKRARRGEEEAEPEKKVHQLQGIRAIAFSQIVGSLEEGELVRTFEEDPSDPVRTMALDELHSRGSKEAEALARRVFERIDANGSDRAHAARILAAIEGPRIADDFIDLAKKRDVTPELMRRTMAELLADMREPKIDSKIAKMVGRGKPHEKLFALRAARNIQDDKLLDKIRRGLRDKDNEVVIATAEILGARKDRESLEDMEKLLEKAKDDELIEQLLVAMSRIHDGSNEWVEKLLGYVAAGAREVRNAALVELAALGNPQHQPVFVEHLAHADWSTRLAALHALERLRRVEVVPPIIERMPAEQGRMLHEFADTLWRLTGQPFRTRSASWKSWWEKEGEGFELISESELEKRAKEEEDRRLKMVTNVEFFGIRVESHRVIFIIDISGSMMETLRGEYVGRPGEVRIEVAKSELAKCIEGLEQGALFNLITFSGGVTSWLDGGVAGSREKTRDEALGYISRLGAGGGTNLYGGIVAALEDPDVDTIFILSDGEPTVGAVTDPFRIREDVRRWNEHRGVVINTIAVGGALQVLEWLAEDSGGSHVKFY